MRMIYSYLVLNIQGPSAMRYEKFESQSLMMYHDMGTAMTNEINMGTENVRSNAAAWPSP